MTKNNDIKVMIIEKLLENPKFNGKEVNGNSKIIEDLALDSLAVMNFVMELEDELNISVPLDKLADIKTIDDLAQCLTELKESE